MSETKTIWSYGEAAKGNDIKPDSSTLYQIASLTKVFTGILFANTINKNIVDTFIFAFSIFTRQYSQTCL